MTGDKALKIVKTILTKQGSIRSGDLARAAGISRQAAHRHLRRLTLTGVLLLEGDGRGARYRARDRGAGRPDDGASRAASRALGASRPPRATGAREEAAAVERYTYAVAGLEEDRVWEELLRKSASLAALSKEGRDVFQYAFTELLNNAIEHAKARRIEVRIENAAPRLAFEILDDGIGIFAHVRRTLGLPDDLAAIQEISKGKVTTDPRHHTGEGIFFSSKVADLFEIESGGVAWLVDNLREDMTVRGAPARRGTRVRFEAQPAPLRRLADVFAAYSENLQFAKTRTVIKLFAIGVTFVSRSEARRLLHGLEKFREVVLDFSGVEAVGQGFVDEVFRVWATDHPSTRFVVANAAPMVAFMIERGRPRA